MPTTAVPQSLRDALGEQAAGDLAAWFDQSIQEHAVPRDEYREVLSRLDVLENEVEVRFGHVEERFDRIDGRLDQMDERFDQINQRFDEQTAQFDQRLDAMGTQFDQRIDKMNDRFDRMHEAMRVQTRWTVGTIALFGTIISVLLAIAQFTA